MVHWLLVVLVSYMVQTSHTFQSGRLTHGLFLNGVFNDMATATAYAMPGDTIYISWNKGSWEWVEIPEQGMLKKTSEQEYYWIATVKTGIYQAILQELDQKSSMQLNFIVLKPLRDMVEGKINDFTIHKYPEKVYRNNPRYEAPQGLIELTEENGDTYLSPHFQLQQFKCKQSGGWPKYLYVDPLLLNKLEYILEAVNKAGYPVKTLYVMSGYRTPYYNKQLGNGRFSRHIYGDAADIFIDSNDDGAMDDLNKDGKINLEDADILYKIIERMDEQEKYKDMIGGLGKYKPTKAHKGFVHTDTRGYKARW